MKALDTDGLSRRYRESAIDVGGRRLLVTNFRGTEQEQDLSEVPNCDGFGRIRHFHRRSSDGWVSNALPIDPASRALGLAPSDTIHAQVFQNAVCNWRCWYCFVPFSLLKANRSHSAWLSPAQLVNLYLAEPTRAPIVDLTGGQPDLTPEWVPWMMRELQIRGLEDSLYLWSDDNLSSDYLWQHLSDGDLEMMSTYRHYGRVCCFKGFDKESFAFNTLAEPNLFERQLVLMARLIELGLDVYSYVTLTCPSVAHVAEAIPRFVDRLQCIHENLPLRVIPLKIEVFSPVERRLNEFRSDALLNQWVALDVWQRELQSRFSASQLAANVVDVKLC